MLESGQKVKTTLKHDDWRGACVVPSLLSNRKASEGTFLGWVPGHGGDVWYVAHGSDATDQAVYMYDEVEAI